MSGSERGRRTSNDQLFQENYATLQRWALQITKQDREVAEDLVHDVYLRFCRMESGIGDVDSIHGYLYSALKNAYLSQLRKHNRSRIESLSLFDHDFTDNALLATDPRALYKVHDHLRAICHFACMRKATSVSASILILRFFHGYFSAEVARLVKRSRNAVEVRLLNARREIGIYLEDPNNLEEIDRSGGGAMRVQETGVVVFGDLLSELRERVFAASSGRCASPKYFRTRYKRDDGGLGREELSHIVSCKTCLEIINGVLHLPSLDKRHPLDTLGPQTTVEVLEANQALAAFAAA